MANQTITQLPDAGPITGTELVPIVQNGGTYKTTTAAISASPSQNQTFLTQNQEITLPNSRYLSTGTGLGLTDGGATSFYRISLNGASGSLEAASSGIVVKNSSTTVVARTLSTSGAGISVSNGDGTGGNPTFQLTGIAAAIANMGGTGMLAIVGGATIAGRQIVGSTNQISVANGNGGGDPTISIADNVVLPGTAAMTIPSGSDAQQPVGAPGQFRFNTTSNTFDGYNGSTWASFSLGAGVDSFSAGSTGLTPSSATTGAVTLGGVLNAANGGTGANSLTGYVKGGGTAPMTASTTVPTSDLSGTISNAQLANSAVTVNGTSIALGASGTITAANPNALTINAGLSGTSYNGSTAVTIGITDTGVTAGSYGSASNTLTATVNSRGQLSALAATPIAIANTQVSGLGTMSTQNANNVAVTGGSINGTAIGASTPSTGAFTSVAATSGTVANAPVGATDLVNKTYVDALIASGIHFHEPVRVESPINLNATYNNGSAGVGATLTNAGTQAALVIDGITMVVADRVLIYQQVNQTQNGIYVVSNVGSGSTNWVLTRASDANTYVINSAAGLSEGSTVFVQQGTTGAGETYTCNTSGVIVFGTTAITFAQISSAQIYSAGTGLTLAGTQFSVTNTGVTAASYGTASSTPTLAINAQGQVTSASNTAIAIDANQITTGAITNAQLQNSAVTVNGSSISLGGSATITAVNPNALTIGTGLSGTSYNGSAAVTVALSNSGVSAATYGSASQVPVFAVNAQGQLTSVTNTAIAIAAGAVSGLAASATTDTTNATNITSGTLPTGRLSGSYTGITAVGTLTSGAWNASTIGVAYGGTGLTATPTNGQLAIGNGTGYSLATLTAGTNVSISNSAGGITINATPAAGGTVTSVSGSGGSTGLTLSGGPITVSGTLTLGGTLVPANGGTGATTLTGYVFGNGTSTMTASTTIPNTAITGLGTMSTQNANSVSITGGAIDGATVGATTASTVRGTTITATTQFTGSGAGLTSVPNSATTATNANTANAIVARDASGNFSAGTITAALNGNASTATSATTSGSTTGNAATATALQTARNIGGVSFNGTASIDLPGVNTAGNQNTSGNAATATVLQTARTIGGVSFNGSANINLPGVNTTGNQNTTGNAATATSADNIDGIAFKNSNVSSPFTVDTEGVNGIGYSTGYSLFGFSDGGVYCSTYSVDWQHQINGDFRTGQIAIRGKNSGTWQSWRTVLDSGNYTSFAPSLTGSGASGTWGIAITGNAGNTSSISNAVGGSYTWTGIQTFQSNQNTTGSNPPLQAYSTGGLGAIMAFHRGGAYAVNFGLDSDNVFRLGGWSAPANLMQITMAGALTMASNVTAFSDERLKKDWAPVQEDFVAKLAKLKSGTYTRIDSEERHAGVGAQSLQSFLPETVLTGNDGTLSVAYGNAAMVSAVELAKDNVELRARIAKLEALVAKLVEGKS